MPDYKKLKNQPLKFVLAEFRFSKIEKIAQYIPDLQESYRDEYPDYLDSPIMAGPNIIAVNLETIEFGGSTGKRWVFTSSDRKESITIVDHKIVLSTTKYDRFEGLSKRCAEMLKPFIEIVRPGILKRVGLRYGDLVLEQEESSLEELVSSRFLPAPEACELGTGKFVQHSTESAIETEFGILVIKSIYGTHPLAVMPDLKLGLKVDNPNYRGNRLVLDFDHYWEEEQDEEAIPFKSETAIEVLDNLHNISREAFWKLTTDTARNKTWA